MALPKLLTPKQVAEALQKPLSTLKKWRAIGEGPSFVRVGRDVRYTEAAILAYIERHTTCHSVLDAHGGDKWT